MTFNISPSGQLETGVKDTNPKDAVGSRKLPWHVIPWRVLSGVVLAFFGGALKYRAFNYRIAGVRASVYVDAAFRHIARFWEGEDWDPDVKGYKADHTGVLIHHLDEAIAGLMVLRDSMLLGNWTDDRPPATVPGWIDEANDMAGRVIDANPDPKSNWTQAEVVRARAVAAALEAFDNTGGSAPAQPAPAPIASSAGADTPEPVSPAPPEPTLEAAPVPTHAYFSEGNFYHRHTRKGLGDAFYGQWCGRRDEFPTEPWTVDATPPEVLRKSEHRDTFVVPEGMVAVRDKEGRATGRVIPEGVTYDDDSNTFYRGDTACDCEGDPKGQIQLTFYHKWAEDRDLFPRYVPTPPVALDH